MDDLTDLEATLKDDSQLKVLICIDSFHDGGAEMFAIRLANALHKTTVNVFFMELTAYATSIKIQKAFLNKNIILFQPDLNWHSNILRKLSHVLAAKRIFNKISPSKNHSIQKFIKKHNIDIVHSNSFESDLYLAHNKDKIKLNRLLSTFHGHYENKREKKLVTNYEKVVVGMMSNIDHIVYTSDNHECTLNEFNYPIEQRSKINYGHERKGSLEVTKYDGKSILKICIVSRAIKEKGWEPMIEAVKEINSAGNLVTLSLVGDGSGLNYFKEVYGELDFVKFLGFELNPIGIVANSHLTALTSFYPAESMPNSVIEYLSQGKPVLASDAGDIPNMISYRGNRAGIICPLNNGKVDISEVVAGIRSYISNPCLIEEHSKIAVKAYEKFSMDICVKKYQALYKSIVEK